MSDKGKSAVDFLSHRWRELLGEMPLWLDVVATVSIEGRDVLWNVHTISKVRQFPSTAGTFSQARA